MMDRDGGGGGDQHRAHDQLGQHRADRGIDARRVEMFGLELLIGHRGLLVEHHPRHDHRADVGGDEIEIFLVGERDAHRLRGELREVRVRRPGHPEEGQFEQAERDRRPLHAAIGAGQHDQQQRAPRYGETDRPRHPVEFADARDARQLGQQSSGGGHRQPAHRHPGPELAERVADQFAVPPAGEDA